jgi:transcriptional regulator with XRE-family HTH domain
MSDQTTPALPSTDGEWVKSVRDRAGLTQPEFAEAIGGKLHRVTVTNWEGGKFPVSRDYVEAILRRFPGSPPPPGLSVSVSETVSAGDHLEVSVVSARPAIPDPEEADLTDDERELLAKYRAMPDIEKGRLLGKLENPQVPGAAATSRARRG